MKKPALYLILMLLVTSCTRSQRNEVDDPGITYNTSGIDTNTVTDNFSYIRFDSSECQVNFKAGENYITTKGKIENLRSSLNQKYLAITDTNHPYIFFDSVMFVFTDKLLNNIFPYWYGTEWDFNGHTAIPNEGTIACGYFVSTTLRDMGLNLNRYKLAQQTSLNEVKSIAFNQEKIIHFTSNNLDNKLFELNNGLYMVGLDYHVGFLYIVDNKSYFIHSNYIDDRVMIESAQLSEAFKSNHYYIVGITGNRSLAGKWLNNDEIQIFID